MTIQDDLQRLEDREQELRRVERLVKRDRWTLTIAGGIVCLITGVFIGLSIFVDQVGRNRPA
jgi:hypothetical protein